MDSDIVVSKEEIQDTLNWLVKVAPNNNEIVKRISEMMPEIHRASKTAGRSGSQFVGKNLSLFILGRTPYFIMRQCLAKIERKNQALRETYFKHAKETIEIAILEEKLNVEENLLQKEKIKIEISEKKSGLDSSLLYIQGALKEIAQYQTVYNSVKEKNNLPDDWDEVDFENEENKHHIKQAFLQAFRDYINRSRIGHGECEYLENVGVHPLVALKELMKYSAIVSSKIDKGIVVGFEDLENWLDEMVEKYKNAPSLYLRQFGISSVDDWYVFKDRNADSSDTEKE